MSKAVLFFADGTEECEALLVVDLLRRAKVDVTVASASGSREILSSHKIRITADALAEEVDYSDVDLVVLPGGIPGTPNLAANKTVTDTCTAFAKSGKKVAAICAAPSVLASLGLLEGKKCHGPRRISGQAGRCPCAGRRSGRGRQHHHQLRSGWCHPLCTGAGAPAGRAAPRPTASGTPSPTGTERRPVPCVLSPALARMVWRSLPSSLPTAPPSRPLRWLGLPCDTLTEAIPQLTPAVRAGLALALSAIPSVPLDAVQLQSPIPCPAQDVVCLGINYMAHSDEAEKYSADAFATQHQDAIYFSKRVTRAVPDGGFIEAHTDLVKKLDYECELAVVLGRDAKDVPAGQTKDYVFGYTILNDVSARDVQTAHKQWYFGKSLDGFTPIGPCIVTADEFEAYPPQLGIRSLSTAKSGRTPTPVCRFLTSTMSSTSFRRA